MKRNLAERFLGFTLAINPIFTFLGLIYLSIKKTQGIFSKIKEDRISIYIWIMLAVSGIISICLAKDKPDAVANYFIPFVFIWLYILGRWVIENPKNFIKDLIRGVTLLALIAILAKSFKWSLSIYGIDILSKFGFRGRGEILYVADNSLGLFFQVGIVGAVANIIVYYKEKRYLIENVITFFLCSGALLITASRGAMIGVLAGLAYLALRYWVVLLIGGLSSLGLFFYVQRFRSIFDFDKHTMRLDIWSSSLRIIKDNFWFGVGPGNFGEIYDKYKPITIKGDVTCSHSNYLNIFVGWGIIGGVLFWGWHLFIFIRAIRNGLTPVQRIIMAILISYFTHVIFNELFAAYSGFLLGLLDHSNFKRKECL